MRNRVLFSNAINAANSADAAKTESTLDLCLHRSQIVVYAGYFDPKKLSKDVLVKQKVVQPAEVRKSSRFEHHICQLNTPRYRMLVLPPQLQFVLNAKCIRDGALAVRKVHRVTRMIPETPLKSVSINLTWHMWPENGDVAELSRRMFGARTNPLHQRFDSKDTFFGTYVSAPQLDGRLQLDVKPVEANSADGTELHLSFAFNYSRDLPADDSANVLLNHLKQWNKAFALAESIMNDLRRKFGGTPPTQAPPAKPK